jgi:hypothetical protein
MVLSKQMLRKILVAVLIAAAETVVTTKMKGKKPR